MELDRIIEIEILNTLVDGNFTTSNNRNVATQANDIITLTSEMRSGMVGIAEGTLNLEEVLCDGEFKLGQVCSNKFEVELFGINEDLSGRTIIVSCKSGDLTTPLFKGIIDSSTKDNYSMSRHIIAYDDFYYKRDTNVASWWNSFWENRQTATLKQIRESLCTYMGYTNALITLPNDSLSVAKYNDFTSIIFDDMLRMICEAQACIPHLNREGNIEFKFFDTTTRYEVTDYEKNTSTFEDYTTQTITGINIYNGSGDFTYNYGTTTNAYVITSNIFLMSLSQTDLTTACTNIYNTILPFNCRPCNLNMIVSDLSFELGKRIDTNMGIHYIMSQTFHGSIFVDQEIRCEAYSDVLDQSATDMNNDIIEGKRWSSINQTVDSINTRVSNVQTDLQGQINDVSSSITQTATSVTTSIINNNEVITSVVVDSAAVTIKTNSDAQLMLNSDGVYIQNDDGTSVASFTKNEIKLNNWVYQETRGGNCLNIFRGN